MTRKNRKKNSKNKRHQYSNARNNTNTVSDNIEKQFLDNTPSNNGKTDPKPNAMFSRNKNYLSLIEKMVSKLREDKGSKLAAILEEVFSILDGDRKERSLRLEVLCSLLSNLAGYDVKDVGDLKIHLNSVFLPEELKKLVVEPSELQHSINIFSLFVFGHYKMKGFLNKGRRIKVHIKEADSYDGRFDILHEAKVLSQLRHKNIVKILGFDKQSPRIAVELMELGTLSGALQGFFFLISDKKILRILEEVTSAMIYIAEKKIVLRNLNIDNVLLDSRGTCKIGDFKYCRYLSDPDGVYLDKGTDMEVDFAAPEVRSELRFSTKSDVWDFGLLMWKVFINLNIPFVPSVIVIRELLSVFISTGWLTIPSNCPKFLWMYLKARILNNDPDNRPTFLEILEVLKNSNKGSYL